MPRNGSIAISLTLISLFALVIAPLLRHRHGLKIVVQVRRVGVQLLDLLPTSSSFNVRLNFGVKYKTHEPLFTGSLV